MQLRVLRSCVRPTLMLVGNHNQVHSKSYDF